MSDHRRPKIILYLNFVKIVCIIAIVFVIDKAFQCLINAIVFSFRVVMQKRLTKFVVIVRIKSAA